MIRGVLFDFNGVLLDDEPVHFRLFRQVLREQGSDLGEDEYYRDVVALDDVRAFRWALTRDGRRPEEAELGRLIERKAELYREEMARRGFPFFAGAADLVRAVSARGLALGVVSGALRAEIEAALAQEGLEHVVGFIVAAEDVKESKPDSEGYRRGLRLLAEHTADHAERGQALEPSQVVAIEDTREGLQAAREAGLRTIGVAQTLPATELRADLVVQRIADLDLESVLEELGGRPRGVAAAAGPPITRGS